MAELKEIPAEQEVVRSISRPVSIATTAELDAVLLHVGAGNRSRGVRELARMYLRMRRASEVPK